MGAEDSESNTGKYQINQPKYTERYIDAWQIAGKRLSEMFGVFNDEKCTSDEDIQEKNFMWLKTELLWPSFDTIRFKRNNAAFSVIVEIIDDQGRWVDGGNTRKWQIKMAIANNMIPCVFRVRASTMRPLMPGWNLFDSRTEEAVAPELVENITLVETSKLEQQYTAIKFITKILRANGRQVFSYTDDYLLAPSIWFQNSKGERMWICLSVCVNKEEEEPHYIIPDKALINDAEGICLDFRFVPINGDKWYRSQGVNIATKNIMDILV